MRLPESFGLICRRTLKHPAEVGPLKGA